MCPSQMRQSRFRAYRVTSQKISLYLGIRRISKLHFIFYKKFSQFKHKEVKGCQRQRKSKDDEIDGKYYLPRNSNFGTAALRRRCIAVHDRGHHRHGCRHDPHRCRHDLQQCSNLKFPPMPIILSVNFGNQVVESPRLLEEQGKVGRFLSPLDPPW